MPEVFPDITDSGYSYSDVLPVSIRRVGGAAEEDRTKLASISRRQYTLKFRRSECTGWLRSALDDFFKDQSFEYEAFYLKDPADYSQSGVSLALVSGATYSLPTSGEQSRHFPLDDANVQVYDGGSPVSHSSVDTDARTITLSSGPSGAVTADFHAYRLVRVDGPFTWTNAGGGVFDAGVRLVDAS